MFTVVPDVVDVGKEGCTLIGSWGYYPTYLKNVWSCTDRIVFTIVDMKFCDVLNPQANPIAYDSLF